MLRQSKSQMSLCVNTNNTDFVFEIHQSVRCVDADIDTVEFEVVEIFQFLHRFGRYVDHTGKHTERYHVRHILAEQQCHVHQLVVAQCEWVSTGEIDPFGVRLPLAYNFQIFLNYLTYPKFNLSAGISA